MYNITRRVPVELINQLDIGRRQNRTYANQRYIGTPGVML